MVRLIIITKLIFNMLDNLDYITDPLDNETDEKPNIASAGPYRVHLDKDRNYFYCTCGKSKAQVIKLNHEL